MSKYDQLLSSLSTSKLRDMCLENGLDNCGLFRKEGLIKALRTDQFNLHKLTFGNAPKALLTDESRLNSKKKALFFNDEIMEQVNRARVSLIQYETLSPSLFLSVPATRFGKTKITNVPNKTYDYLRTSKSVYSCYVNFADETLFGYWYSPLFAQDEIMVAEHPDLARITVELNYPNCFQAPFLISNVKRTCSISDIDPIYGNQFAQTSLRDLKKHVTYLKPMTMSNILVIAAIQAKPSSEGKKYSKKDIATMFNIIYTSFRMVVIEKKLNKKFARIVVNTGGLGTGAFGNNKKLIAVPQILAANCAGVDQVRYFTHTEEGDNEFQNAARWIQFNIPSSGIDTFAEFVDIIAKEKSFVYGKSNNT